MVNYEAKINFPWFVYPGYPCRGGYTDFEQYKEESIRLYKFLKEYQIKGKMLFHICIGAAMDEMLMTNNISIDKYDHQYSQLFPNFIEHFVWNKDDSEDRCQIVIISPNRSFSDDNFTPPNFISTTNSIYNWEMIGNKKYRSKECGIDVDIFYTPMLHNDQERNMQYVDTLSKDDISKNYISDIIQTSDDIKFINSFYKTLENLFEKVNDKGGIVTCFSTAVFDHGSELQYIYNKYAMFSEIVNYFSSNSSNRLLCEWKFIKDNYNMTLYGAKPLQINYGPHKSDDSYNILVSIDSTDKYCIKLVK